MSEELETSGQEIVERAAKLTVITAENRPFAVQVLAEIREELRSIDKQRKHMLEPVLESQRRINNEARKASAVLKDQNDILTAMLERYDTDDRKRRAAEVEAQERMIETTSSCMRQQALTDVQLAMDHAREVLARAERDYAAATDENEKLAALTQVVEADTAVEKARDEIEAVEKARDVALTEARAGLRGSVIGSAGAVASSTARYRYELDDITKVPDVYLVPPEERLDRGKLAALSRGSQRPQFIPGLRIVESSSLRTRT